MVIKLAISQHLSQKMHSKTCTVRVLTQAAKMTLITTAA